MPVTKRGLRLPGILAALAALSMLAACGTTVPLSERGGLSSNGNELNGGPASAAGGATGGSSAGQSSGVGSSGSGRGYSNGIGGGSSVSTGSIGQQQSGPANAGRPSTRPSSIRLGVIYLAGLQAAYQAAGAKSSTTDAQADAKAVIAYINTHGGVAGIPLVGYYYGINADSTTDPDTQLQAACVYFTSDQRVDMVATYTPGGLSDSLLACLRSKGVPAVDGSNSADISAATLQSDPEWWEPAQMSLDRLEAVLPGALTSQHWADSRWGSDPRCATVQSPRVGVVTFDGPDWVNAYNQSLKPAFQRVGFPVYDAVFMNISGTTANQLAEASSAVQSAVLKFSSECIDHVAFVSNVAVDYLFMNVAEQQQYSPRYGLTSLEGPPVIIQNLANPSSQLHGALGYGWSPYSDVNTADFDPVAGAPAATCIGVLKAAGLAPTDNNSAILALPSCEGPFFAVAAFSKWLASPPGTTLVQALNGMGPSYRSSGAYGASLTPTQHDGANAYRQFGFVDSCTCFRYTSSLNPLPGAS